MEYAKYYVYTLNDPRSDQPFYVGRSTGTPTTESMRQTAIGGSFTRTTVEALIAEGVQISFKIVGAELLQEDAALLERSLIQKFGRKTHNVGGILTNGNFQYPWSENVKKNDYATIQIPRMVKNQITEYCNKNGKFIGRFVAEVFHQYIANLSGSLEEQ